jgi:hypothetical protein
VALLAQILLAQGCGGGNSPSTTGGTGGVTSTGGTSEVTASGGASVPETTGAGGASTPETTGAGGTTTPETTGSGGAAGTTGTKTYEPLCSGLLTAANVAPTKNGICVDGDPPLCYKTCGPQSIGFKSETCSGGVYVEQSGCDFLPERDYSCYKIPDPWVLDPSCPTETPQATTVCNVAPCILCNVNGGYLDSGGSAKTGYCVCPPAANPDAGTSSKWSCASTTAWPCPAGQGC